MKIRKFLTYANSIDDFSNKINSIERKSTNFDIKAATAVKLFAMGVICQCSSIHEMMQTSTNCNWTNIFKKNEVIPKTHGFRDCISDIELKHIKELNDSLIDKLKENKVFRNNLIDGLSVVAFDGVEQFNTNKEIEGLPVRKHRDEHISRYYKSLGVMNIGENTNIMIDLEELKQTDIPVDSDDLTEERLKAEGEITVIKRLIPDVEHKVGRVFDVFVGDALFSNAPVLNKMKEYKKDAVVRIKDERRDILKDANAVFSIKLPTKEYETVEIAIRTDTTYSKNSKKKNSNKTKVSYFEREITNEELYKRNQIKCSTCQHPKRTVKTTIYEKVIKRTKVWDDQFELNGYEYGKVRMVKAVEITKEGTKSLDIITTLLNHKLETIVKIMHRRWNIENNGFRTLKNRYNLDHCYVGEINAIRIITQLIMYIFNLMNMYFEVRTKVFKESGITYKVLSKMFIIEIASDKKLYELLEF